MSDNVVMFVLLRYFLQIGLLFARTGGKLPGCVLQTTSGIELQLCMRLPVTLEAQNLTGRSSPRSSVKIFGAIRHSAYAVLADNAVLAGKLLYKVRPKTHAFHQISIGLRSDRESPGAHEAALIQF